MLPLVLMGIRRFRTITGCVIASIGVVVGMWLERFLIIVPSLGHKYLPYSFGTYRPQPVEIIIAGATFAAMTLLYVLFAKVVPIISIWELKAGDHPPAGTLIPPADRGASARGAAPMKAVYGLYPDGQSAQQAVNRLRAAGLADRDITVLSAQPMEDFEFGHMDKATWMWWIACGGGLLGMASAFGLVVADRDLLADQRRRAADVRLVAEPDHHVRADDARRDSGHGDHAGRHARASAAARSSTTPRCPTARSWSASRIRLKRKPAIWKLR